MNRLIENYLKEYIEDKCIPISAIARKTGISDNVLYKSFSKNRRLRGDELLLVCDFLKVEPMECIRKLKQEQEPEQPTAS